jgi:hypothetical protein
LPSNLHEGPRRLFLVKVAIFDRPRKAALTRSGYLDQFGAQGCCSIHSDR